MVGVRRRADAVIVVIVVDMANTQLAEAPVADEVDPGVVVVDNWVGVTVEAVVVVCVAHEERGAGSRPAAARTRGRRGLGLDQASGGRVEVDVVESEQVVTNGGHVLANELAHLADLVAVARGRGRRLAVLAAAVGHADPEPDAAHMLGLEVGVHRDVSLEPLLADGALKAEL